MKIYIKRVLIGLNLVLLQISLLILFVASTASSALPRWVGYTDVFIALCMGISLFFVYTKFSKPESYRISYAILDVLIIVILIIMWVYRDVLDFNILIPGLAWRLFWLVTMMPRIFYELYGEV